MKEKNKTKRLHWFNILIDFIPEFLGVLIALLLAGWFQDSSDNEFINKSISSIHYDCETNMKNLKVQDQNMKNQIDTFNHYLYDNKVRVIEIISKNGGIQMQNMLNSGWKILERSSLVSKMDYKMLTMLSEMDSYLSHMDFCIKTLTNLVYTTLNSSSTNDKKALIVLFRDGLNISYHMKNSMQRIDSLILKDYGRTLRKYKK
ncbi:MAG: hypothetical protein EHM93_04125 [Bacteroidales bacterium]|nr:MAG: hypothetical protein EHM93_04125 [Bacteroidales bacterium]